MNEISKRMLIELLLLKNRVHILISEVFDNFKKFSNKNSNKVERR